MRTASLATLVAAVMLTLLACEAPPPASRPSSDTPHRIDAAIVADQPTIPDEQGFRFAGIGSGDAELAEQWRRFRLQGEPVEVDFDTGVVLFVGFGESGSCPYEHSHVVLDPGRRLVSVVGRPPDANGCTDDYNPRTLGLRVDRRDLPDGSFLIAPPNWPPLRVAIDGAEAAVTPASHGGHLVGGLD
jgi:hypothetical protein